MVANSKRIRSKLGEKKEPGYKNRKRDAHKKVGQLFVFLKCFRNVLGPAKWKSQKKNKIPDDPNSSYLNKNLGARARLFLIKGPAISVRTPCGIQFPRKEQLSLSSSDFE